MWNTIVYEPLYNAFIYILANIPGTNLAIAIIVFTIIIKTILFPLYKKNILSQQVAKKIAPELKKIQETYKNDRQEMSKKTMQLYKENGTNPFSAIVLLFIQIPILLALYFVFKDGVAHQTEHLYSFVRFPENVDTLMFGFIDATKAFIPLSLLVGVTQAFQAKLSFPKQETSKSDEGGISFQEEFAKNMRIQVLYVLPVLVGVISLGFPSAIALYWVTSNIFGVLQELYIKRNIAH